MFLNLAASRFAKSDGDPLICKSSPEANQSSWEKRVPRRNSVPQTPRGRTVPTARTIIQGRLRAMCRLFVPMAS
jgi:hypothetical protein